MTTLNIPIAKAGKDVTVEVDINALPDEMIAVIYAEGLKTILNSRMSKVGSVTKLAGEELTKANSAALKIANENLDKLMKGELKAKGKAAKSGLPREVQTEARRIARELVKNEMRKANIKPSTVAASDITKAADAMIAADPSIVEQARVILNGRTAHTSTINIKDFVHEDPKKVAKLAAEKAAKAATLSAKQAGLVKGRKRPEVPHHTAH